MPSTKYPCYDAPVHIPGVPGVFAGVIVEVDDVTHEVLSQTTFDGQPVPYPPDTAQPSTPEEAEAASSQPSTPEAAKKAASDTPKKTKE